MSTRLEQIKARLEKASKPTQKERRPQRWVGSGYSFQILTGDSWHSVCEFNADRQPNHVADCELIANAPDDLAALLAVVESAERWEEASKELDEFNKTGYLQHLREDRCSAYVVLQKAKNTAAYELSKAVRAFREERGEG